MPQPEPAPLRRQGPPAPLGSPEAARRLFAISRPISRTLAETYLRTRHLTALRNCTALRYHPRCYYRGDEDDELARDAWPALIAAVTDPQGALTGLQRTWLDPSGRTKAPVSTPRRALGHLLGNAVRFGVASHTMAAGEGIETMLSLRSVLPAMPVAAALSANHLAALLLPPTLRRLYVIQDNDRAGRWAAETLADRAREIGIEALTLAPEMGDLNDDLRVGGIDALADAVRVQLSPEDVERFWVAPRQERRVA